MNNTINKHLESEFLSLSTKFLFVNCNEPNTTELNTLLNELNGLDYKNQQIVDSKAICRLIESFNYINTNEDTLIVKSCFLIKTLISKQKVQLPENVSTKLIDWILRCIEKCFYSVLCEALDVLDLLFRANANAAQMNFDKVLSSNGVLVNLLLDPSYRRKDANFEGINTQEIYYSTITCIESILSHLIESESFEISDEQLEIVGKSIIHLMFKLKRKDFKEIQFYKIATSSLNSLRLIARESLEWTSENVGELLGITKSFMMIELPDVPYIPPQKITTSQQTVFEPQAIASNKSIGMVHKTRKLKTSKNRRSKPANEDPMRQPYSDNSVKFEDATVFVSQALYRTSDSDFSDNERNRGNVDRQKQSKLRQSALFLISTIAQIVEKRIMFGYWHSLFPTDTQSHSTIALLNCVLRDSSSRCRIVALQATTFLLHKSKPFLIQAEIRDKNPSNFTPFSVALGNMITSMYDSLTQALIKEGDLTVLTQILKCLSVFIQATPFNRLRPGIVTNFVKYVKQLVRHKDPTVIVASLMVMGNLISITDMTAEIYELVEIPKSNLKFDQKTIDKSVGVSVTVDSDEEIDLEEYEESLRNQTVAESTCAEKMSWLLEVVLENLGVLKQNPSIATSVRTESLQILSAMTAHFLLLKANLKLVCTALNNTFKDPVPEVRMYATRVLDFLGHAINSYLSSQENISSMDLEASTAFWLQILPQLIELIQNVNQTPQLRASCGDALANIGIHVFERLHHDKQILLISVLSGCGCDEESLVKAASIRALAVYAVFPSLRDDLCFIDNTTEAVLRIIKDKNLLIRIKASWSLGNVVDALLMTSDHEEFGSISDTMLQQILSVSLEASTDNDKVKCNAVRTIGHILKLLKQSHLENQAWINLFEKSVKVLQESLLTGNNVKTKWNVCYALGCMMKNSIIYDERLKQKWQDLVFPALSTIIKTSSNFKVRINAAVSITIPDQRTHYGQYFMDVWSLLLLALEQSNHLIDFNEYKHRDGLQEQICFSIAHLINLMLIEDSPAMKNELFPLIDITKQNWERVLNRLLPEKSAILISATGKLKEWHETKPKNQEQKNALQIMYSCFHPMETNY